ncbi:hypothetical protein AB0395_46805 [Streptosporangium sp. NPDC051023]|uniref:hypothetical protein n=1 Tax=Streptosporangium sp. NPDC051023 TaxID=3155410 RepID=UPI00344B0DA0
MDPLEDDDRPLRPEEMLRLIEEQQATTSKRLGGDPLLTYTPWGIAWAVGFGALFLNYTYGFLPRGAALSVLFSLMILALAISSFAQRTVSSQVRGESAERGMMYGFAWMFGLGGMIALGVRLSPQLPADETGLLWAAGSMTVVAALYIAGGAVWRVRTMFYLGAGVAVLNMIGVVVGPAAHALLMSVGAGGAFVAIGVVQRVRRDGA